MVHVDDIAPADVFRGTPIGDDVTRFIEEGLLDQLKKENTTKETLIVRHYRLILQGKKPDSGAIHHLDDIAMEAGFQPEYDFEFPRVESNIKARIPHIIHQVLLTSNHDDAVPEYFLDYVKTFFKHNPAWTYFFWTDRTARALLSERYPELCEFYNKTKEIVVKGDMLRYVLLYEYGGLYADMDVVNFRPLDIVTLMYPCILVEEPFEHAVWWYTDTYAIINAIMFCRPKHPFFKQLLDHIPSRENVSNIVNKLGPGFLTSEFRIYHNLTDSFQVDVSQNTTSTYLYKGTTPVTHDNGIYVPNTRFFMDSPSPALKSTADAACKSQTKTKLVERMCHVISRRGYTRSPANHTFLDHLWTHTWSNKNVDTNYTFKSIRNMTKHFTNYFIEKENHSGDKS